MAFSDEDALKMKFEITKSFGESAKSYVQIASAGLALPLLFTQALFGKNAADSGLRVLHNSSALYASWACFLVSIACGLLYQWMSVRRVWDQLHDSLRKSQNAQAQNQEQPLNQQANNQHAKKPGTRFTWWVVHFPTLNLSGFYGGMVIFFFAGAYCFVWFAASVLLP